MKGGRAIVEDMRCINGLRVTRPVYNLGLSSWEEQGLVNIAYWLWNVDIVSMFIYMFRKEAKMRISGRGFCPFFIVVGTGR